MAEHPAPGTFNRAPFDPAPFDTASFDAAITAIAAAASGHDRASDSLGADIARLAAVGALVAALPAALTGAASWGDDPAALCVRLRALGRANLAVGRLYEGHVNAAQLIALYGLPSRQAATVADVARGDLLGVWGADGAEPVMGEARGDGFVLTGGKIFCSGLGVVRTALVSVGIDGGTRLFAVDVTDMARADPAAWAMSGMRATGSGDYDFSDMVLPADAALGVVGDYFVEPHFLGGMYRMCAVQVGGIEALMHALIDHLRRRGHGGDPVQQIRLGHAAAQLAMARAATDQLAKAVGDDLPATEIAMLAVLTREAVEQCATAVLGQVERAAGTTAHRHGGDLDRIRRDLGLYLRQAAVDARLTGVGAALLQTGLPLSIL